MYKIDYLLLRLPDRVRLDAVDFSIFENKELAILSRLKMTAEKSTAMRSVKNGPRLKLRVSRDFFNRYLLE